MCCLLNMDTSDQETAQKGPFNLYSLQLMCSEPALYQSEVVS